MSKRTVIKADEELVIKGKLTVEGNVTQIETTEIVNRLESNSLIINSDGENVTAELTLKSDSTDATISFNAGDGAIRFNQPVDFGSHDIVTTGNIESSYIIANGSTLTGLTTTIVDEGSNLYFTQARVRGNVSVVDAGGDGSLAYNTSSGVFTYTGPNQAEANARIDAAPANVRAHLSATDGVTYSNTSGIISIDGTIAGAGLTFVSGVLDIGAGDGILVDAYNVAVDSSVVRTSGNQSIAGNKTFTGTTYVTGNIEPTAANTYNLGSWANHFGHVFANVLHAERLDLGDADLSDIHATFYAGDATGNILQTNTAGGLTYAHNTTGGFYKVSYSDGLQLDGNSSLAVDSTVVRTTGNQTITGDTSFVGNVSITGNLDVTANINSLNVVDLNVQDTQIILNANAASGANSSVIVNRGSDPNTYIKWDESADKWKFSNNGSAEFLLPTSTTDLAEGANLYFTTSRVNSAIDAYIVGGNGLTYSNGNINVGAGSGITVNTDDIAVDATVVRTTGDQSLANIKTFTGTINVTGSLLAPNSATSANGAIYYDNDTLEAFIYVGGQQRKITPAVDVGEIEDVGSTGINIYAGYRNTATGSATSTLVSNVSFKGSISTVSNITVIGNTADSTNGINAGAVHILDNTTGNILTTIYDPVPGTNRYFGGSVATDGTHIAAKANSGNVYVFSASTGNLVTTFSNVSFGSSTVSLAVSNGHVAIGNPSENLGGGTNEGVYWIYKISSGSVVATGKGNGGGVRLGNGVATSGSHFFISSVYDSSSGGDGYVLIFTNVGGYVSQINNNTPSNNYNLNSIAAGGNVLVMAVPSLDYPIPDGVNDEGGVYVYNYNTSTLLHTLYHPDGAINGSRFGAHVATDGNTILVYSQDSYAATQGNVFIYDVQTGALVDRVQNPNTSLYSGFGSSISIKDDTFFIGANGVAGPGNNKTWNYSFGNVSATTTQYHGIKSITNGSYIDISEASNVITVAGNATGIRGLISASGNINYNSTTGVISENLTTTDIDEGNNLYFTAARARGNISGTGLITYNSNTGVISTTADNYSNWNIRTDSGAGATHSVTSNSTVIVSGGTGITVTNTGGNITIASTNSADIEAVTAGSGLTGGGTSGAVTLNVGAGDGITVNADNVALSTSGVASGTYGNAGAVSQLVIDSFGRTTSATNVSILITANQVSDFTSAANTAIDARVSGGAGLTYTSGVLAVGAGTGITVNADDVAVNVTYIRNQFSATGPLSYDSANGVFSIAEVGDISEVVAGSGLTGGGSSGSVTLNIGAGAGITVNADNVALTSGVITTGANTYGTASQVPAITVDTYGRVTSASNTTISITASQVSDFTSSVNTAIDSRIIGGSGLTYSGGTLAVGAGNYIQVGADDISVDATSTNTANKVVVRDSSGNFAANIITATATSARYADLAENYLADADYLPGTVLVFGGDAEVTAATTPTSTRIAGVVTTQPAHVMNSHLDGTHVACIALRGRVPVKVMGVARKGDVLVSAGEGHIGYAVAALYPRDVPAAAMVGKAIGDKLDAGPGVVEALI